MGGAKRLRIALAAACLGALAALVLLTQSNAFGGVRESLIAEAREEGRLIVYSTTDEAQYAPLLEVFRAEHPQIEIVYESLSADEVYSRFRRESDAGRPSADLLISSAMDLQVKLANDGYAQPYRSPERRFLPRWAVWKDEAFAVTAEPIVIGYNRRLLPATLRPRSHDDLAAILHANPDRFRGRVGTYDPARSPTGMLYFSQDLQTDGDSWDLIAALGRAEPRLFTASSEMMDQVSSGELLLAYNLIGSYALARAASDPNFGVIIPEDYALLMSRVAVVARNARHSAAARLFLDFMLSRRGQELLARQQMVPLRQDVGPASARRFAGANMREVTVGPALMANLDSMNRDRFLSNWQRNVGLSPAASNRRTLR